MEKLLIITGPTASGKTALAVDIARSLDTSIISCDSVQIYKGFDIGSAKPGESEKGRIAHYLMDFLSPDSSYSTAQYAKDFDEVVNAHFEGKTAVVCGGTALYIQSILYPMKHGSTPSDLLLRRELEALAKDKGNDFVHSKLSVLDPETAKRLHPNDLKRVIRAIEVATLTGRPLSQNRGAFDRPFKYTFKLFGLYLERQELYEKIDNRVDAMLKAGLLEEVEALLKGGLDSSSQSMQAIGYKEALLYLLGKCSYDDFVSAVKQHSRNYAKRQITFMKRLPGIVWLDANDRKNKHVILEHFR